MSTRATDKGAWWAVQAQRRRAAAGLFPALLLLLAALVLLPFMPAVQPHPDPVSGGHLYITSRLLSGDVLYRDVWTHTPPLLFLANALGLLLSGGRGLADGGRWGVWVVELLAVWASGLLLYSALRRYFAAVPSGLAAVAVLLSQVFFFTVENPPERLGLLVQCAILALLVRTGGVRGAHAPSPSEARMRAFWRPLGIGVLAGLAVMFGLTLFGLALIAAGYLAVRAARGGKGRSWLSPCALALGLLLAAGLLAGGLAAAQSLPQFADQVLNFNLRYSGINNPARAAALGWMISELFQATPFFTLGLLGWIAAFIFLLLSDSRFRDAVTGRSAGLILLAGGLVLLFNALYSDSAGRFYSLSEFSAYRLAQLALGLAVGGLSLLVLSGSLRRWLNALLLRVKHASRTPLLFPLVIALIDLPLELLLFTAWGRRDLAAAGSLMPALAIFLAFFMELVQPAQDGAVEGRAFARYAGWIVALPVLWMGVVGVYDQATYPAESGEPELIAYLQNTVQPGEEILQWGTRLSINAMFDQAVPSVYGSQEPLFNQAYTSPERIRAYLAELEASDPEYVVDTFTLSMPLFYVEDGEQCGELLAPELQEYLANRTFAMHRKLYRTGEPPYIPQAMGEVYRWVCQNYEPVAVFGKHPLTVYRRSADR